MGVGCQMVPRTDLDGQSSPIGMLPQNSPFHINLSHCGAHVLHERYDLWSSWVPKLREERALNASLPAKHPDQAQQKRPHIWPLCAPKGARHPRNRSCPRQARQRSRLVPRVHCPHPPHNGADSERFRT